jgi:3-oxoacyl-[acyl-carrier-protein] synthase III
LRSPIFVDGCAFAVGEPQPVESLLRQGALSPESYEDCLGRGIKTFCAGGSIAEMGATAAARAITAAGIPADAIDCVVVSDPSSSGPMELGKTRIVLRAQDCAAFCAGIEAAAQQIAGGTAENVLLLLTGHVPAGTNRYNPELGTVFGDGAAACIVSSRRRGFAVISAESWLRNVSARATQPPGEQLLQDFQGLQSLLRLSYESAAISAAAVTVLCGTHGNQIYLELMAEAAGLSYERVYDDAMQEFGHVFSCDNLIALSHFLRRHGAQRGRVFCLVGWSPLAAGVVLLEELA